MAYRSSVSHHGTALLESKSACAMPVEDSLSQLPLEIFLEISRYLDPTDKTCLAPCCRSFFDQLFNEDSRPLQQPSQRHERQQLLLRLARDLGDYTCCFSCEKLGDLRAKKWPAKTTGKRLYQCSAGRHDALPALYHYFCHRSKAVGSLVLAFQDVHTATHTRVGSDLRSRWLALLSWTEIYVDEHKQATSLQAVDADIIDGELLLRVQTINVYNSVRRLGVQEVGGENLCRHLAFRQDCLRLMVILSSESDLPKHGLQCIHCDAFFTLDTVDYLHNRRALIVSRWINLGKGRDPKDPVWKRHVEGGSNRDDLPALNCIWRRAELLDYDARIRFERAHRRSQATLTNENLKLSETHDRS